MKKTILIDLPIHVKKFFMIGYVGYKAKNGTDQIDAKKLSELGNIVTAVSRPIPWTQKAEKLHGEGPSPLPTIRPRQATRFQTTGSH